MTYKTKTKQHKNKQKMYKKLKLFFQFFMKKTIKTKSKLYKKLILNFSK